MVLDLRVNSKIIKKKMEHNNIKIRMYIREIFCMEWEREKVSLNLAMEINMKAYLNKIKCMDMEYIQNKMVMS